MGGSPRIPDLQRCLAQGRPADGRFLDATTAAGPEICSDADPTHFSPFTLAAAPATGRTTATGRDAPAAVPRSSRAPKAGWRLPQRRLVTTPARETPRPRRAPLAWVGQ